MSYAHFIVGIGMMESPRITDVLFGSFSEAEDSLSALINNCSPIPGTNGQFVFTPTSLICEGMTEDSASMLPVASNIPPAMDEESGNILDPDTYTSGRWLRSWL